MDFEQNKKCFQLQLYDADGPELYQMRYDAVFTYVDECSPSYSSSLFRLPVLVLFSNPANELAK